MVVDGNGGHDLSDDYEFAQGRDFRVDFADVKSWVLSYAYRLISLQTKTTEKLFEKLLQDKDMNTGHRGVAWFIGSNVVDDSYINAEHEVVVHPLDLFETIYDVIKEMRPTLSEALRTPAMGAARAGDLSRSCFKVDRARQILGFTASLDVMAGLKKTLQWHIGS